MNHRAILFLFTAGTCACGSPSPGDTGDERAPSSLEDDGACIGGGFIDAPTVTVAAGPLESSVPRSAVPKENGIWFTDSQSMTLSDLTEDGRLRRFPVPFPSETVFDAAVASDGSVWFGIVPGDLIPRLGRMTPEGATTLVTIPSGERARRLARGADGTIWFTSGESIGRVGVDGVVHELDVGAATFDLASGADGSVWFTEPAVNRVGRIDGDGAISHFDVPGANGGLTAIALGPDGNVWFTEANTGTIGRIDREGTVVEHAVVEPPAQPKELAAGPDGRLWFTVAGGDSRHPRVGSLSPCGTVSFVALPALADPIDFRPPADVPAAPYGIAGGDDEIWVTARLEPFETGAVLRIELGGTDR